VAFCGFVVTTEQSVTSPHPYSGHARLYYSSKVTSTHCGTSI